MFAFLPSERESAGELGAERESRDVLQLGNSMVNGITQKYENVCTHYCKSLWIRASVTLILTLWSALGRCPIECSPQLIKQFCSKCATCPPEMKSSHCDQMSSFFRK